MSEKPFPTAPNQYSSEPPPPYATAGQPPYPTQYTAYVSGASTFPPPVHGQAPAGQAFYQPPQPPVTTYYPPPTTTVNVLVTTPTVGVVGPHPINTQCPHCNAYILTSTRAVPGTLAWLICICCILFGFWLGCCLIPFCIDELQDVEHRCPQCYHYIGTYRRAYRRY